MSTDKNGIKIDNSADAAIKTGKWEDPGKALYDAIGHCSNRDELGKEAYLVYPRDAYKLYPRASGMSRCKYPHHVVKDDDLVLSVSGVRAAYSRAKQQGIFTGTVKRHLENHYRTLGIYSGSSMQESALSESKIEDNFFDIETYLESLGVIGTGTIMMEASGTKEEELVPVYAVIKCYSQGDVRNDGTEKDSSEKGSSKFASMVRVATRGDRYSHSLVSLDDSFERMYSYQGVNAKYYYPETHIGSGFVVDNMMSGINWMNTESIYITVMFVSKDAYKKMQDFIAYQTANRDKTVYAPANLLKAFIGKPSKTDFRFTCSAFVGYMLSLADPKLLTVDYSRVRPEDITVLPRAFYVMNVRDAEDMKRRKKEFQARVKQIYATHREELMDYNNHLPKLMLVNKANEVKTSDKLIDWIFSKV